MDSWVAKFSCNVSVQLNAKGSEKVISPSVDFINDFVINPVELTELNPLSKVYWGSGFISDDSRFGKNNTVSSVSHLSMLLGLLQG